MVLLGLPSPYLFSLNDCENITKSQDDLMCRNPVQKQNKVVAIILDALSSNAQFARDTKLWNIFSGNHEIMLR